MQHGTRLVCYTGCSLRAGRLSRKIPGEWEHSRGRPRSGRRAWAPVGGDRFPDYDGVTPAGVALPSVIGTRVIDYSGAHG